jgi:hypothetical protein
VRFDAMKCAAFVAVVALLAPARASADGAPVPGAGRSMANDPSCGAPDRSWIKVANAGTDFVDAFRTELASEGFDACRDGGPASPVATVSIATGETGAAVEIVDVVTSKRVSREVDLRSIPSDGRALALALAADELLRASWAELALANAPPPAAPVPEPVQRAVDSSLRSAALPATPAHLGAIGVMLAGEGFAGGKVQWGADARAEWFVTPRFATTLRFGLRSALPSQTPEGEVRASAVLGGIGVAYAAVPPRRFRFDLFARFDAAQITYAADTTIDATATSGSALALLVSGGAELGWAILPALRLNGELGAIVPVRPVRATEADSTVVVGVSGVGALVGLGMGGMF